MSQNQSQVGSSSTSVSSQRSQTSSGSQVYFIDASVPGYEALALSLGENSRVFVIENTSDAFLQMDKALASLSDPASSVHIYSHGRDGAILLGGQWIDEAALSQSAEILKSIGDSLAQGADILLYSCNTAASSLGESFIERMARLASVAVAASDDITGANGDWTLEKSVGDIETAPVRPGEWLGNLGSGDPISGWGVLEGTANDESITGFVTNDRIYGKGGKDTMTGGDGHDAYYISGSGASGTLVVENSNEGSDTVYSMVNNFDLSAGGTNNSSEVEFVVLQSQSGMVAQSATGNDFGQTMVGNDLANNLTGKGGNDLLYGYEGDDFLDGGNGKTSGVTSGTDYNYAERNTLIGGKGDDNYIVRGQGDVVVENNNEGTDNVFSFIDYTLGANVENLTILDGADSASSANVGMGNALNNVLRGNSYANVLAGDAGNDTLYGSKATDSKGDTLDGGTGNDAFYVYSTQDIVLDSAGNDSLYSTADYTLGANIENLFLQGQATTGQGNSLNNRIVGNEALASNLTGGGGNDTLEGGYGNDTFNLSSTGDMVIDKGGQNTALSSVTVDLNRFTNAVVQTAELTGNTAINATAQRNVATNLKGNSGNNSLVGGALNDTLDGGSDGADSLVGGLGDDLYYVRNARTIVTEAANAGTDTINASVDYTLGANVENLVLQGTARVGTGNNLSNDIDGSGITTGCILHGGVNSTGLAGDTLRGGSGTDQIYSYNANDSIDFGGGNDVLYISYAVDGGSEMNAAAWKAYFSARGVALTDNVTVIYRGNPVAGSGTTSGVSIDGTSLATNLLGTDKNDTLRAESATATILDGGKGSDSMVGSSTGDVFYVDSIGASTVATTSLLGNVGDIVVAGGGKDTVRSTVNIDLNKTYAVGSGPGTSQFTDVEVVELQGATALSATGNLNASTTLLGNTGTNNLVGGNSDDVLDGGAGADVMTGGSGNDLYYVDNSGDRVVEKAGEGVDSIKTNGISINLGTPNFANVEYVENIGSTGISITGTTGTETIIAGSGGDTLDGKGGSDSINGGAGNDLIYYYGSEQDINAGTGMDTLYVKNTAQSINNDALHNFEVVQLESVVANARAIDIDASDTSKDMTIIGNAGSSSIVGGAGNDSIVGGGGQDSIFAGAGDDFVEISANQPGYGALEGGLGADTLSFGVGADSVAFAADGSIAQVISGKTISVNASGFEVYSGGAGNDTLDASTTTDGRTLSGGAGNDVFKGGSGADTLIADGGNDTIYTNDGYDTVKLTKDAVGSSITVIDFDAQLDSINDTELTGWTKTVSQSGADAVVSYINLDNTSQKITVTFKNAVGSDIKSGMTKTIAGNDTTFDATKVAASVPWQIDVTGTGNNVSGGNLNDQIKSHGGNTLNGGAGNDKISGQANDTLLGGSGNDSISVAGPATAVSVDGGAGADAIFADSLGGAAAATITGGADNDRIYISGINASGTTTSNISGGDGNDSLYLLGSSATMHFTGGGAAEVALDSVTLNGNAGNVSVSGMEYYVGTTGADSVDASGTTYLYDQNNPQRGTLHYSTNGGNDTYTGGAAADFVVVDRFDGNSAVSLVGGGDSNDATDGVYFGGGAAVSITLNSSGAVSQIMADGATVGASISGFESFGLTGQNDFFDATAFTSMSSHAAERVDAGKGDDTLKFGDVAAHYYMSAYAGDGNDSVVVGSVSSDNLGKVILDGGSGTDKLTFTTDKSVSLTFSDTAAPALNYYTTTTNSNGNENVSSSSPGSVSISGFEYYKGANSGNYFDAKALSAVQGSLTLEGGEGHDNFYLGNLASGQVTLAGGKGSDRFHLTSVANGASVFVDGGTDGEAKDKLGFFDESGSAATNVALTLAAAGNIGAVSIAGQKANITSSGLNAYTGGNGNDTIDGSAVTSVDNAGKVMILEGGSGNDLIKSGNISGGSFQLEGGLGNDTVIGGAGSDLILLGGSDYTDTGNDSITTGGGNDTLVVNALGNGVVSTITDFDASKDKLDDSGLLSAGWARAVTTTPGKAGTIVTYSKDITTFSLNFTNFTNAAFLPSVIAVGSDGLLDLSSSTAAAFIMGTEKSDTIKGSNGNCNIVGNGGDDSVIGGNGSDSIVVQGGNHNVYVNCGHGIDTIRVDGDITGGNYSLNKTGEFQPSIEDAAEIYIGNVSGGNVNMRSAMASSVNFHIGNVTGGKVTVNRDGDWSSSLYFDGDSGVNIQLRNDDNNIAVYNVTTIFGSCSSDYIDASKSVYWDLVNGRGGNDTLMAGSGGIVLGGEGEDLLIGAPEAELYGGSGNDTFKVIEVERNKSFSIMDFSNNDTIDDTALISTGWKRSFYDTYGGSSISYSKEGLSFSVFLKDVPVMGNVINGRGTGADYITGTSGDDVIDGKGGADTIYGYDGNDQIYYYGTGEIIDAGLGDDTLRVKTTVKYVDFSSLKNFEVVRLEDNYFSFRGTDIDASSLSSHLTIFGNSGSSQIWGSKGKNIIDGGGGDDTIWGNVGDDTINFYGAEALIDGAGGYNVINSFSDIDLNNNADGYSRFSNINEVRLIGSDSLTARGKLTEANILNGNGGDNTIIGGYLADRITGAGGNDYLDGNGGDDTLRGGSGNDSLVYRGGEGLFGGDGRDSILAYASINLNDTYGDGSSKFGGIEEVDLQGTDNINVTANTNEALEIRDNAGDNVLIGGSLSDTFVTWGGDNTITTNGGGDYVLTNGYKNTINLFGDEELVYCMGKYDIVRSDKSINLSTVNSSGSNKFVGVDEVQLTGNNNINFTSTASNITEKVIGNSGNNSITGGEIVDGMGGNDTITTFNSDNLIYYYGNETIDAGSNVSFFNQRHGDTLKVVSDARISEIVLGSNITGIEYVDALDVDHGILIQGELKSNLGGSAFSDTLIGGGWDTLYGNAGNDVIDGKEGHSSVFGGAGNDTIYCHQDDTVRGGTGADTFILSDTGRVTRGVATIVGFVAGEDVIDDSALISAGWYRTGGSDIISYIHSYYNSNNISVSNSFTVRLTNGEYEGQTEVVRPVENGGLDMQNSTDSYKIIGNTSGDSLYASSGNCTLIGGWLEGGRGDDYLELNGLGIFRYSRALGAGGRDTLVATGLTDSFLLSGGDGDDLLTAETLTGSASLCGDAGNDTICVDQIKSGSVYLSGGAGDDIFKVGQIGDSSVAYATFNDSDSALGADTYQLQASGYAATINESGKDADVVDFFGVGNLTSLSELSNNLQFKKYISGNNITLAISGIAGGKTDSILNFVAQDFSGDKINLYKDQSAGGLLFGGSIDISSIVSHVSDIDNTTWTKLSFAQSGGNITATGKA